MSERKNAVGEQENPIFPEILPVGQLNFPEWEEFEAMFRDIFKRKYYTNHGPLLQELEASLEAFLNVKHAICVTNATLGLIMAAKALNIKGKVLVPGFTFIATIQSLTWAGLEPIFCDVDPNTHLLTLDHILPHMDEKPAAILGVHLWGNSCHREDLNRFAQENKMALYYDAAHAFGCTHQGIPIGNFGQLEVFSFHATKVLNAAEGGCICTNDDEIAMRLRNMRSSYGAGPSIDIPLTGNARMSEAQAALALLSLKEYPHIVQRNFQNYHCYKELLQDIPGIRLIPFAENEKSNYQYVTLEISEKEFGISRDDLVHRLEAQNIAARRYFYPGMHRTYPYNETYSQYADKLPITDILSQRVAQLPSGKGIGETEISKICHIIIQTRKKAWRAS